MMTRSIGRPATAAGPPAAGHPRTRLLSLTGLRFLAALVVFVYHASRQSPTLTLFAGKQFSTAFHDAAQPAGGLGASFFFVLSGFILTWSARPGETARQFWRHRLVKIYPNYFLAWLTAMALFAWVTTPAWVASANLLMIHPWIPGFSHYFSVDPPTWSMGAELLFYTLFPALLHQIKKIPASQLKYWLFAGMLGTAVVPAIAYLALPGKPGIPTGPVGDMQYWFAYIFPPVRLFDFTVGILVARMILENRWRHIHLGWALLSVVAAYVIGLFVPFLYGQWTVFIIPIALVIASAARADTNGLRTFFSHPALVWLGNISFAFYLVHFVVLLAMRAALGKTMFSTWTSIGILAVDFVITLVVAAAMYTFVESPLVRRFSTSRGSSAPLASVNH